VRLQANEGRPAAPARALALDDEEKQGRLQHERVEDAPLSMDHPQMKRRMKINTTAEQAYVRDLETRDPLKKVAQGEAQILSSDEYPEPIKRFLAHDRSILRVKLSTSTKNKTE
jgi:uncharacterized caspase-like protein